MTSTETRGRMNGSRGDAWRRRRIWDAFTERCDAQPDHELFVAFDDTGREARATYDECRQAAEVLSASFHALGMRRGDRLALIMTNQPEWIYTYLAAQRLGLALVPVNTRLTPPEIEYVLTKARVKHLILLDAFRRTNYLELFAELCPEWADAPAEALQSATLPDLTKVIVLQRAEGEPRSNAYDFRALMESGRDLKAQQVAQTASESVVPEDVSMIKFTSGSTGFPKGAVLEQWGTVTGQALHVSRLQLDSSTRWFSAMPFFHAGGSINGLITMIMCGGTLVFTEAFKAEQAVDAIEKEQCNVNWGVAAMTRDEVTVLKERGRKLTSVRFCMRGNTAQIDDLHEWIGADWTFSNYGTTENYGPSTTLSPDDPPEKKRTTNGRFLDGLEYRVVNPSTGEECRPDEPGECLVRGLVMREYYDAPEETARAIDPDGWLHTQDLVSVDEDGYARFVGRLKLMIKVGGENVSVEEVEAVVRAVDGVADCCIIGVPDDRYVEALRAYVLTEPGVELDEDQLREWCGPRLARFKTPRDFIIVDSLPLTGSGKIDRAGILEDDPDAQRLRFSQAVKA